MLVVQGGPGTGKTVVALHRAAYLLYTYRFPLEDQGVLVIGPNRVFLRYIERVLPSLGEAGVEQVVLADLVPDVRWAGPGDPGDTARGGRVSRATPACPTSSTRPSTIASGRCATELRVPFRTGYVRLSAGESARIVKARAGGASGGTTAAGGSSRARSSPRWRRRGAANPATAGEVRSALRHAARRAGGARADVAGADAGRAAPRPVRLAKRCCGWPAAAS